MRTASVRDLGVIRDSATKGTDHAEEVRSCVCGVAMTLSKSDGAVVVNSPSASFVTTVTSDVALALYSDGLGTISTFSALGVCCS